MRDTAAPLYPHTLSIQSVSLGDIPALPLAHSQAFSSISLVVF